MVLYDGSSGCSNELDYDSVQNVYDKIEKGWLMEEYEIGMSRVEECESCTRRITCTGQGMCVDYYCDAFDPIK